MPVCAGSAWPRSAWPRSRRRVELWVGGQVACRTALPAPGVCARGLRVALEDSHRAIATGVLCIHGRFGEIMSCWMDPAEQIFAECVCLSRTDVISSGIERAGHHSKFSCSVCRHERERSLDSLCTVYHNAATVMMSHGLANRVKRYTANWPLRLAYSNEAQ